MNLRNKFKKEKKKKQLKEMKIEKQRELNQKKQ